MTEVDVDQPILVIGHDVRSNVITVAQIFLDRGEQIAFVERRRLDLRLLLGLADIDAENIFFELARFEIGSEPRLVERIIGVEGGVFDVQGERLIIFEQRIVLCFERRRQILRN